MPAQKRALIEDDEDNEAGSYSQHSPGRVINSNAHTQHSIELSGYGIANSNSSLNIGRDFKVIHVENSYSSPPLVIYNKSRREREEELARDIENALKAKEQTDLNPLKFPQLGMREENVGDAHTATCGWVLSHPKYLDWLDETKFNTHNGLLWIKAKPGAGKSTLMKYILSHLPRDSDNQVILSFFFYARGDELEKSTIGLYRTLLVRLFDMRPHLREKFESRLNSAQWTIQLLESLFKAAFLALQDSTLLCFIDGLDECKESEIRRMLQFLVSLNSQSRPTGSKTKLLVCFASRYYPNITIRKGLVIHLEDQDEHRQDISRYIDSTLCIGVSTLASQVRSSLQKRVSGIFMWVVLVVDMLNREYDSGRPDRLLQKLLDIPTDLHELVHDILTRDEKNPDGLLCGIQWVLFSKRPLSPQEVYFATICGVEPQSLAGCHSNVSPEDVMRYVLDISKGLVEIEETISPKSGVRLVRFIHESVRDVLLKQDALRTVNEDLADNLQGHSHDKLRSCCAEYISSTSVKEILITSRDICLGSPDISTKLPFLDYATRYILHHAEEAELQSISQSKFLSAFPLKEWIDQANIYRTYNKYSSDSSLLYLLAEMHLPALIKSHVAGQSCFIVEGGRFAAPILAALATGSFETVAVLLQTELDRHSRADHQILSPIGQLTLSRREIQTFSQDFRSLQGRGIVAHLAQYGNEAAFRLLIASGHAELDERAIDGTTPLSWAARCGHGTIVQLLLDNGVGIDIKDSTGRTPLSWASGYGHMTVAKILIDHGAAVNSRDMFGWNPLSWAVAGLHRTTTRLLLASGASTDARDNEGRTPLFSSTASGNRAVCQLLIDKGANINARDNLGRTPLSWAVGHQKADVMLMLLDRGARTDVPAYSGGDLITWASRHRHTSPLCLPLLSRATNPPGPPSSIESKSNES